MPRRARSVPPCILLFFDLKKPWTQRNVNNVISKQSRHRHRTWAAFSPCSFVLAGNNRSGSKNISVRIAAGITTGALAVLFAQPTDVVKVRLQAGSIGRSSVRYSSTLQAYKNIAVQEGTRGLWKGTTQALRYDSSGIYIHAEIWYSLASGDCKLLITLLQDHNSMFINPLTFRSPCNL